MLNPGFLDAYPRRSTTTTEKLARSYSARLITASRLSRKKRPLEAAVSSSACVPGTSADRNYGPNSGPNSGLNSVPTSGPIPGPGLVALNSGPGRGSRRVPIMYPFQQTLALDDDSSDDVIVSNTATPLHIASNGSPRVRGGDAGAAYEFTPLRNNSSAIDDCRETAMESRLSRAENGVVVGGSSSTRRVHNRHYAPRLVGCISRSLRPVFIFLRLLSFFPVLIQRGTNRKRKRYRRLALTVFLFNVSLGTVLFNLYLVKQNLWLTLQYTEEFGLMHACTVSTLITGIKPAVAAALIALFSLHIKAHTRLIRLVDAVDLSFRSAFRASPPVRVYCPSFFIVAAGLFLIPFAFRIFEYVETEQRLGEELMADAGFFIVPLLMMWNTVPLLYYCLHNKIVRFYLKLLMRALDKEHSRRVFSLRFYYEQFLRITLIQEGIGSFFNPFVLLSLAWSMAVLCLSIYFVTQPNSSLWEPINAEQVLDQSIRQAINKRIHFTIGWAALQIAVALLHIALICNTGMKTNETTRQVVNAVLRVVPDSNAELDRFQISCFVHKMSTQFMWGMTVWRAFPLERSTFFTMVSVIVTYSFLLLKLKDNPGLAPVGRTIYITGNLSIEGVS